MDSFQTCDLGEIAELYDSLHQTPQYSDGGYPMIRVTDIRRGFVDTTNAVRVDEETYSQFSKKYKPKVGDILFSRVGSYGNSAYVSRYEEFCLGQNTVCISPERSRIEPLFLYSALNSDDLWHQINSLAGGASQGTISLKNIRKLQIPFPSLPIQQRIAGILSGYDELIEISQRRMQLLEAMAGVLYREWFVHFHFPGHENTPRVASTLGEIPHGWQVAALGVHLAALESGKRPKGGIRGLVDGVPSIGAENIKGIGQHDFSSEKLVSREFFQQMRRGVVRDRDVAIYKDGAYIGRSSYFRDGFPHTECCVNEHVFLLRSSNVRLKQNALYLWLQQPDTLHAIRASNANAAQPGINQQSVNGLVLIVPDSETAENFDRVVEPMFAELTTLAKQTRNLRRTRDLLLPRLLSGQVQLASV